MFRLKIIVIILFMCYEFAFSSDCTRLPVNIMFSTYEWIFIGMVTTVSDTSYNVKVLEVFKGSVPQNVVGKLNNYVPVVNRGVWLFYADSLSINSFDLDMCSASRSFRKPHSIQSWATIPPPPNGYTGFINDDFMYSIINMNMGLNELFNEISSLRALKNESYILGLTKEIKQLRTESSLQIQKLYINNIFLIIVIILMSVTLLMVVISWNRLKKPD